MKIVLSLATALVMFGGVASAGGPTTTLFERSYFSPTPTPPAPPPQHRAPAGGPLFMRPHGVGVSSGYRRQWTQIVVGGQVVDQLNTWDSWIQFHRQY